MNDLAMELPRLWNVTPYSRPNKFFQTTSIHEARFWATIGGYLVTAAR